MYDEILAEGYMAALEDIDEFELNEAYENGYNDAILEAYSVSDYERDAAGYEGNYDYRHKEKDSVLHKEKHSSETSVKDRRRAYKEYVRRTRAAHQRPMSYRSWCVAYCGA